VVSNGSPVATNRAIWDSTAGSQNLSSSGASNREINEWLTPGSKKHASAFGIARATVAIVVGFAA